MKDYSAENSLRPAERAASYWFEDGLPELVFGFALALTSGVGLLWRLYFPNNSMRILTLVGYVGLVPLFVWDRKILTFFKSRVTYPRTGYVRPPGRPTEPPEVIQGLKLNTVLPAAGRNVSTFPMRLITLFVSFGSPLVSLLGGRWSLPVAMIAIAALFYLTNPEEEPRYSLWSLLPLALSGFVPSIIGLPEAGRLFFPGMLGGLWLLVRGTWKLVRYLHQNPYPGTNVTAGA